MASRWRSPKWLSGRKYRFPISSSCLGGCGEGGLVSSVRGPGGGYMLGREPEQMRIADIIIAVDEPIKATRCTPGSPNGCHSHRGRCLTHDLWEELGNQIHLYLSSVTLADVCERRVLGSSRMILKGRAELAAASAGR